jgi:hypothetical protein
MALTFQVPDTVPDYVEPHAYQQTFFPSALTFSTSTPHPNGTPARDYCARALDRVAEEFRPQPLIEKLLCLLADRATAIEQALINVSEFRQPTTALGQQLDELGKAYGEPRNGETDDDYRRRLIAMAQVVDSKGTGEDLLELLVALDNGFSPSSIQLIEHHPACLIMTCVVPLGGQLLGETFGRLLHKAKAGGVCLVLLFEEQGATLFVWSGDTGSGWAEEGSPGTGGIWAEGV